jgi:hypothetical protein
MAFTECDLTVKRKGLSPHSRQNSDIISTSFYYRLLVSFGTDHDIT